MSIVKSGFLHRQSTILRRWKRNWFDLWSDGRLVFFDDQHRRDMEDEIHMRVDCINIRSATACQGCQNQLCEFLLVCQDPQPSYPSLLIDSVRLVNRLVVAHPQIDFAQTIVASAPPPYSEYGPPPPVYVPDTYGGYAPAPPSHGTQIIYTADGQPYAVAYPYHYQGAYPMRDPQGMDQVIVHERQRDDGGDVALGMLAGAATGLALGSLFVF
uniref:Pleckstrin homology domain containing, family B (evectins) member 2 n=1 Tax=Salmo trutta TaxID=8032 RepID=A0A674E0T9_SALTR